MELITRPEVSREPIGGLNELNSGFFFRLLEVNRTQFSNREEQTRRPLRILALNHSFATEADHSEANRIGK